MDASFRMIGALIHEKSFRRDVHDTFNLFALIPIVGLNAMNWSWGKILAGEVDGARDAWHGEYFQEFWWTTLAYFVIDLLWVVMIPGTVRSPSVIVIHHSIVLVYIMVPWLYHSLGYAMGACMSVELNTWFLIARRMFNQRGLNPFGAGGLGEVGGIKIKLTSVGFYLSWVLVRLVLYPALVPVFWGEYLAATESLGTYVNAVAVAPVFQVLLTCLNVKWSLDLLFSKLNKSKEPSKGL